jgi:hypothetical protein
MREQQRGNGLARAEVGLFAFGVLAFAFLMVVFGEPLAGALYLPVVVGWIVAGFTFIWWFNRFLARADERKISQLDVHRRRRTRR